MGSLRRRDRGGRDEGEERRREEGMEERWRLRGEAGDEMR